MTQSPSLQPTLWRTCRVLANHTRLKIFALLSDDSAQTVSSVALRLELSLAVASQYLRSLEARGFLSARRVGRRVEYRLKVLSDGGHELVQPLLSAVRRDAGSFETIFGLCTAFTHPRRIEVFKALRARPRTLSELHDLTRISSLALRRHLRKLEARGFVACQAGIYSATASRGALGRALARLAGA
jgi:DNA-binding transcriptional ArsR family regulator